ncbi:hypothetical protein BAN20980_05746 [Burkholderia anthina]|uniref:Uncharacterized protein n=1 Tax=Burkholderia anthina TaxID=179879 RepID=A0A6P2GGS6_9BURK|nr:hypothetical protein BAN20980_05746 [Burkholderia anthina]
MRRLSAGLAGLPFPCFSPDAGATRVARERYRIALPL